MEHEGSQPSKRTSDSLYDSTSLRKTRQEVSRRAEVLPGRCFLSSRITATARVVLNNKDVVCVKQTNK
jgi:hypothetical protein